MAAEADPAFALATGFFQTDYSIPTHLALDANIRKDLERPADMTSEKKLSKGQLAYEQERARKAGKSLNEWLKYKAKQAAEAEKAAKDAEKAAHKTPRKKGVLSRLLDKAHKPL